jgi:hypothetical protein
MAKKIIQGFEHLPGMNCESSAVRDLLHFRGVDVSEPMIFGLAEGLNFIYWDMKMMDFAFTGGRIKPDMVFRNFAANAGIEFEEFKTTSKKKGWQYLKDKLDSDEPVMLRLDNYYLDYFDIPIHLPAHYVTAAGYDDENAYLADTDFTELQATSLESLADARGSKISVGLGAPKHLSITFPLRKDGTPRQPDVAKNLRAAIRRNAEAMLNPPIKNIGIKGIRHAAAMIPKWIQRSGNPERCLKVTAELWEHGGTGGGIFRKMYSDFLSEAGEILNDEEIARVGEEYASIGAEWTSIAKIIDKAGDTLDENMLAEAGERVAKQADREEGVLRRLA